VRTEVKKALTVGAENGMFAKVCLELPADSAPSSPSLKNRLRAQESFLTAAESGSLMDTAREMAASVRRASRAEDRLRTGVKKSLEAGAENGMFAKACAELPPGSATSSPSLKNFSEYYKVHMASDGGAVISALANFDSKAQTAECQASDSASCSTAEPQSLDTAAATQGDDTQYVRELQQVISEKDAELARLKGVLKTELVDFFSP
jgi:hypothetical protein